MGATTSDLTAGSRESRFGGSSDDVMFPETVGHVPSPVRRDHRLRGTRHRTRRARIQKELEPLGVDFAGVVAAVKARVPASLWAKYSDPGLGLHRIRDYELAAAYLYTTNYCYLQVNRAIRQATLESRTCDQFEYYIFVLCTVTFKLSLHSSKPSTVFFGLRVTPTDGLGVGRKVVFKSFRSTTRRREVAEHFAKGNSLWVVDGLPSRAADLAKISDYDEDEVLLYPCTQFVVTKITSGSPMVIHVRCLQVEPDGHAPSPSPVALGSPVATPHDLVVKAILAALKGKPAQSDADKCAIM